MVGNWLPRISASCPGCGEVALSPHDLVRALPIWNPDEEWIYRFECPRCAAVVARPLDDRELELLVSLGVEADFGLDGPLPDLPHGPGGLGLQERSP